VRSLARGAIRKGNLMLTVIIVGGIGVLSFGVAAGYVTATFAAAGLAYANADPGCPRCRAIEQQFDVSFGEFIRAAHQQAQQHVKPVERLEHAIDEVVVHCPDALSPEAEEQLQAEIEAWLRTKAATCAAVEPSPFAEVAARPCHGTPGLSNA
jgi:hypothetical protein